MSSGTSSGAGARPTADGRLAGFSAVVWLSGLLLVALIAWFFADEGGFDVAGLGEGVDDDYRLSPWTSDTPIPAEDLGGGLYEGRDGAMISLTGVDVGEPIILTPEPESYFGGVWVTGPGGRIVTTGDGHEPPDFDSLGDGRVAIMVEQPDVELWVNGPNDGTWRGRVSFGGIDPATDVVSGFESDAFLYDGGESTARLSARGDGDVMISVATVHGTQRVLSAVSPVDQSIAWQDSPRVLFDVQSWGDAGWRIGFPTDAASPGPGPTGDASPVPSPTDDAPAPEATP
jgi:hypothetical protein